MQITEQVHALKLPFTVVTPAGLVLERFVYVYLICGQDMVLIDCGVQGNEKLVFEYIGKLGRKPEEIKTIILTHSHPDHLGAALAIQKETGARIAAHPAEKPWIEDTELQFSQRPVPGFHKLVGGPVTVDTLLEDGQILYLDDSIKIKILHTPGHSDGSICLYMPDTGVVFSADAIPIPGDVPIYDDVENSLASIYRLEGLTGINHLLSAWDEPRSGSEIASTLHNAADYIHKIQGVVELYSSRGEDTLTWCQAVMHALGMPPQAVNPLVIRTFQAHVKAIGSL